MTSARWSLAPSATAPAIAARIELDPPLLALAAEPATPQELQQRLRERGLLADALRVMAHAFPAREAVFLALECVRSIGPSDPADGQMLVLCDRWVRSPSDQLGRDAFAAAEKAGMKSASAWVAIACFWSGTSIAPAHVAAVPPVPGLAAKAAAGAMLLAAVAGPPLEAPARQKRFLEIGDKIATGALRPGA